MLAVRKRCNHNAYRFTVVQGWLWFGYEVKGMENVPADGGALILYYHGALPIDYYYFVAKVRNAFI